MTSPGLPGELPDPYRISGRDSRPLPDFLEGLPTLSRLPGKLFDPSHTFGRAYQTSVRDSRPLLDFREGLLSPPGLPGGPPNPYRTSKRSP